MGTILNDLADKLRTSLWFIPSIMAAASIVLAYLLVRARDWLALSWMRQSPWLAAGDPDGARQILATIAGSTITVTGVIFSVTLVSLSLASQQFGPRLLRTFMRDRSNQVVLGTFIGTFIYCMLVLRVVQEAGVGRDVPYLAVTFAVVLALVALAVLIYFIHHVAASIQADTVIMNVNRELHETMQNLYPHSAEQREEAQDELEDEHLPPLQRRVSSAKAGYVRAVDVAGLLDVAVEHNLVIHIVERPGRFVINGEPLADVYEHTPRQAPDLQRIDEAIRAAILIGPNRTAEQDIEFSIAQLVEIAVRSLSPSLNDPFTAMACLDRLGEAIAELGRRNMSKLQRHGSDGTCPVFVDRPTYSGMVNLAFDQIRQNAQGKVAVIVRMLEVIETVVTQLEDRRECLEPLVKQARMVAACGEATVSEEYDRSVIADRYQQIMKRA